MSTEDAATTSAHPDRWSRAIDEVIAISRALAQVVDDQVRSEEMVYERSLRLLDQIAILFVEILRKIETLPAGPAGDRALVAELEGALTALRFASTDLQAGPAALQATIRQLDELQAKLVALRGSPEEDLATLFKLLVRAAGTSMAVTVQTRVSLETANLRAIASAGRSVDVIVEALAARSIEQLLITGGDVG